MNEITLDPPALARPRLHRQGFVHEAVELVPLLVLIFTLVNLASARFIVEGTSMQPNFHSGEFLLVSRVNYLVGAPQRGDIVVFQYPRDPDTDYIKRIIALPNQTVEIRDTKVYVDGVELDEPYINEPCGASSCPDKSWTLGPTEYFVMGDNRNHSQDSRVFGPVDRRFIVGEALVRYWPPQQWGIVRQIHLRGN